MTTALVIGGAGFVGKRLVQILLDDGRFQVRSFDIRSCDVRGATSIVGDLRDIEQVSMAIQGCAVVFHCAAITPTRENDKNKTLMRDVNVGGTRNVIAACQRHNVSRLVFTSSSSVVFEGRDLINVDEHAPYAQRPMDFYSDTKAEAERLVLAANSRRLKTCALRPASVFGEGDPLFVPSLVANARAGKNKYFLGSGRNMTDFTYVGNIAAAHVQAADALTVASSPVAGQAYFITNAEPRPFWGFCGDVLEGLGYARPSVRMPWLLVYLIALLLHYVIGPLAAAFGRPLSTDLTPLKVTLASCTRTFSCAKAQRDFGYKVVTSMNDALAATLASFPSLQNQQAHKGRRRGTKEL